MSLTSQDLSGRVAVALLARRGAKVALQRVNLLQVVVMPTRQGA